MGGAQGGWTKGPVDQGLAEHRENSPDEGGSACWAGEPSAHVALQRSALDRPQALIVIPAQVANQENEQGMDSWDMSASFYFNNYCCGEDWYVLPRGYATLLAGLNYSQMDIRLNSPVVRVRRLTATWNAIEIWASAINWACLLPLPHPVYVGGWHHG